MTTAGDSTPWPPGLWALVLLAALLRLGYVLAYPQVPLCPECAVLPDYVMYDEVGRNVAAGRGFVGGFAARTFDTATATGPGAPEVGVGPVYPLFLAIVYTVAGSHPGTVRVAQAMLSTLMLFPLFASARWVFGQRAALAATAMAAGYPAFTVYSGMLLTEALSTIVVVVAIWAVLWAWRAQRAWRWALAGAIMAVLVLLRGEVVPLAAFVVAIAFWRRPTRATAGMLVLYLGVMSATVAPWAWRNYQLLHRFVPVAAREGDTLWISVKGWTEWHFDDPELRALVQGRSYLEQQDAFHDAAVREILSHPMEYALTRLKHLPDFWLSGHSGYVIGVSDSFASYRARGAIAPLAVKTVLLAVNTVLIVAGLIGLAGALRAVGPATPDALLLAAPVVCIALVHLFLFAAPRYQVPIMPFLLVFAGSLWRGSPTARPA